MKELNPLLPLSSFADLARAQAFEHRVETYKVTSGVAGAWFGEQLTMYGVAEGGEPKQVLALIEDVVEDRTHPLFSLMSLIKKTLDRNSFFGLDPTKDLGIGNIQSIQFLVSLGVFTQEQADQFLSLSISVNRPYENTTQEEFDKAQKVEINLPNSTTEQTIEFTISESLDNPEQVEVYQRYGTTNDLTPWHSLKSVSVRFHQDVYKVFIPQCSHEVRELKITSPVDVTVI